MNHEVSLLLNITMALVCAFGGGMLARRVGLPSLVGYLAAGVAIGPFTPGFVGDTAQISQLSEIGIIFLMFGVGLHFSLGDLWSVRRVAVPGAVMQMVGAAVAGFLLSRSWGWEIPAALVLGLAVSIASTVVLLRELADNGLLNSPPGRVAVGWLVLEDLATIVILVLLPSLVTGGGAGIAGTVAIALGKTAGFVVIMLLVGGRFLPWLLGRTTSLRSRELFILAVVAAALGTAVGAADLFGVSLPLGAFLAGAVLSRSSVSHEIAAGLGPLRDVFSVLFFVSVGMLVNPSYLLSHAGQVAGLALLVVLGKSILTLITGAALPAPAKTVLVVAAGLSQIGEFSFIVGQTGVTLGILSQEQYSLILAAAVVSIMFNPFMFRFLPRIERLLRRLPPLWNLLERRVGFEVPAGPEVMRGHVVVVGCGRVGEHIVSILGTLGLSALVVESDPERVADLDRRGIAVLYGDAANSEILAHAHLGHARALVVTLPDESAAEIVVASVRREWTELPVLARGASREGVERLSGRGANIVIHPELEGGLEMMRHTLLVLGVPAVEVQQYADAVRRDHYDTAISSDAEHRLVEQMTAAVRGMEVAWRKVGEGSSLVGETLAGADLRRRVGVSVIAVIRSDETVMNPGPDFRLRRGDVVGVLGGAEGIAAAEDLFREGGGRSPFPEVR